jgi:hypothetical protein
VEKPCLTRNLKFFFRSSETRTTVASLLRYRQHRFRLWLGQNRALVSSVKPFCCSAKVRETTCE